MRQHNRALISVRACVFVATEVHNFSGSNQWPDFIKARNNIILFARLSKASHLHLFSLSFSSIYRWVQYVIENHFTNVSTPNWTLSIWNSRTVINTFYAAAATTTSILNSLYKGNVLTYKTVSIIMSTPTWCDSFSNAKPQFCNMLGKKWVCVVLAYFSVWIWSFHKFYLVSPAVSNWVFACVRVCAYAFYHGLHPLKLSEKLSGGRFLKQIKIHIVFIYDRIKSNKKVGIINEQWMNLSIVFCTATVRVSIVRSL